MRLKFWEKSRGQDREAESDLPKTMADVPGAGGEWRRWLEKVSKDGSLLAGVHEDLLTPKLCLAALAGDRAGAERALPAALLLDGGPRPKPWLASSFEDTEAGRSLLRMAVRLAGGQPAAAPSPDGSSPEARARAVQAEREGAGETAEDVEKALMCVLRSGMELSAVPVSLRSEAVCFAAVRADGRNLDAVPAEMRTQSLCLDAVRSRGSALGFVPMDLRSPEMCREAVLQSGSALQAVPKRLRTAELCANAVVRDGMAIGVVPDELLTPELCMAAVRQCGEAVRAVPRRLRTDALCVEAARHDWRALDCVPMRLRSPNLCLQCALQNPRFFEWSWVPEKIRPAVRKATEQALAEGRRQAAPAPAQEREAVDAGELDPPSP